MFRRLSSWLLQKKEARAAVVCGPGFGQGRAALTGAWESGRHALQLYPLSTRRAPSMWTLHRSICFAAAKYAVIATSNSVSAAR